VRKPDFFIVGAPKCGTTAMQDYLSQHPEIFMPREKELHFFGSDLRFSHKRMDEKEYLGYFRNAMSEKRVGEASVWYLYSKLAAGEIKEFNPSSKIIIMLRNPVDVLYSLHSRFLYDGNEDIVDFREALQAEQDRKRGLRIPKTVMVVDTLYYKDTIRYTEQVRRYFDVFGRENVLIIIFEDFKNKTYEVYKETLSFLGVNQHFQPLFRIVNPNKRIRSEFLRNLLINPPQKLQSLAKILLPSGLRQTLVETLWTFSTVYEPRTAIDPKLRNRLREEFASDVKSLSILLGRDLVNWTKG
jgi:hypothetical protein